MGRRALRTGQAFERQQSRDDALHVAFKKTEAHTTEGHFQGDGAG